MADTCRTCGMAIIWHKTPNGKSLPLDAEPQRRVILTLAPSFDIDVNPSNRDAVAEVVRTYTPHFATCPDAAQHRRRP